MSWPFILGVMAIVWMALIFYFGTAGFGRSSTQKLIDQCRRWNWLWKILNALHGHLRAGFHYVEFSGLMLMLYLALAWLFDGKVTLEWQAHAAFPAWMFSSAYAWFDEWHQSLTPNRCFRRIDFLHSLHGAALMFLAILLVCNLRL